MRAKRHPHKPKPACTLLPLTASMVSLTAQRNSSLLHSLFASDVIHRSLVRCRQSDTCIKLFKSSEQQQLHG